MKVFVCNIVLQIEGFWNCEELCCQKVQIVFLVVLVEDVEVLVCVYWIVGVVKEGLSCFLVVVLMVFVDWQFEQSGYQIVVDFFLVEFWVYYEDEVVVYCESYCVYSKNLVGEMYLVFVFVVWCYCGIVQYFFGVVVWVFRIVVVVFFLLSFQIDRLIFIIVW